MKYAAPPGPPFHTQARLVETGELVAVKVQRPTVLETVSKDLYVLRRAAEVRRKAWMAWMAWMAWVAWMNGCFEMALMALMDGWITYQLTKEGIPDLLNSSSEFFFLFFFFVLFSLWFLASPPILDFHCSFLDQVYQGLVERFAPQQRTDYVALLNEWAVGFYTELDFKNEANNQKEIKALLRAEGVTGVYIPSVVEAYTTRRLLVSEWVDGVKLSECAAEEIRELIGVGQECFLTQLLQVGVFHSDPHPGNLMKIHPSRQGEERYEVRSVEGGGWETLAEEDEDERRSGEE